MKSTGYKIIKLDFLPNIILSFISIFVSEKGGRAGSPGIIQKESGAKRFYFRFIFPVEKLISRINIRFFGYEFILMIRK